MKFKFLFVIITIMAVLNSARAQTYKDDKYTIILNVCGKVEGNTNNYSTPEKTVEGEKTCWRVNCKASNSDANGNEDGSDNYRKRCFSDTELFNSVSPSFNANMNGDVGILPQGSGSGNNNGNNNNGNGNGNGNGNVNNGNGNINGNGNVNINGDGNTVIVNMGDGTTIGVGASHPCWNSCNGGKNGTNGCRSCCKNTVGADGYGGSYVMVDGTWWPSSCVRRNGKIRNRCLRDGSGKVVRGGGSGGVYVDGGSRNCTYTYSERECLGDEDYDLTVSGSGDIDCAECSVRGGGGRVYKQHWLSGLADVMGAIAPPLAYFGSNWLWSNAYENANSQWAAAASVGFEQCQVMQTNYIHSIYGNGSPGTPGYLAQNELPFQDLKPPGCNGYNLFGNFSGFGGGVGGPWGVGANPWMGAGYSPGFMAGMYGPYGQYSPWGGGMGPGGVMGGTIGGINIGLMGGVPGGMMAGMMSGYPGGMAMAGMPGGMAMAGMYGGMAMAGMPGGMAMAGYGGMAMAGVPGGGIYGGFAGPGMGGMAMAGVPGGGIYGGFAGPGMGGMAMAGVPGGGIYGGFAGPGMGGMAMAGYGGFAGPGMGGMAMAGYGGFAGPGMGGMAMAGYGGMAMAGYGGFGGGGGGPWGPWGGPGGNGTMPWNGCTSYWNCSGGGGGNGMNWGAIQSEYGSNQQAAQQDWYYQQQALGNQYQNAGFNLWSHGYGPSMYGGGSLYGNQAFNPWNVGGSAGGYFGGGFYL
jgi:hypothetical protein